MLSAVGSVDRGNPVFAAVFLRQANRLAPEQRLVDKVQAGVNVQLTTARILCPTSVPLEKFVADERLGGALSLLARQAASKFDCARRPRYQFADWRQFAKKIILTNRIV
jgi:hypothetical protein